MDDSTKDPLILKFKSIEEECAYWKNRCSEIKQTSNSREKQIRELKNSLIQVQSDNETMRVS